MKNIFKIKITDYLDKNQNDSPWDSLYVRSVAPKKGTVNRGSKILKLHFITTIF